MFRNPSRLAAIVVLVLSPARLFAGGPAWLCLPVDGVTSDNAKACAALVSVKLADKLFPPTEQFRGINVLEHQDQWYLTFYMGKDVRLREVDAALKGSNFSVPRDKLRLFGHTILEIDARTAPTKKLLANLVALNHVSLAKSDNDENLLLVTIDIPYPVDKAGRPSPESVGWDKFERTERSSEPSTKSESPATPESLPSYNVVCDIVAKYDAALKDIRWSTTYSCRPLGGVAAPDQDIAISAAQRPGS